ALFIANLSFASLPEMGANLLNQAKLGVFAGSLISGLCGYLILDRVQPKLK
ncbi:MAG: Na+/H+ antiporter NhaA, partial [Tannerellaceae bacterium]|nr:Na+/H+ antiporter NhaA [Tannerellaceae bacterium]